MNSQPTTNSTRIEVATAAFEMNSQPQTNSTRLEVATPAFEMNPQPTAPDFKLQLQPFRWTHNHKPKPPDLTLQLQTSAFQVNLQPTTAPDFKLQLQASRWSHNQQPSKHATSIDTDHQIFGIWLPVNPPSSSIFPITYIPWWLFMVLLTALREENPLRLVDTQINAWERLNQNSLVRSPWQLTNQLT